MLPKQLARRNLDCQLAECGWLVQNVTDTNILGLTVREFRLKSVEANRNSAIPTQSKLLDRQPTDTLERVLNEVSKGVVYPDLAGTLGAKISRLAASRSEAWHADIEKQTSGQPASKLITTLFDSVDADKNRELAASKFSVTPDAVAEAQARKTTRRLRIVDTCATGCLCAQRET